MTLIDLSQLQISEQLELLYTEGIFLSKRRLGTKTVILYQLGNLYVEIYYRIYRQIVDRIAYSDELRILDPYLDQISVNDIFPGNS